MNISLFIDNSVSGMCSFACNISMTIFILCLQLKSLNQLEIENQEAAQNLDEVVKRGEQLLQKIQEAQHDIAQVQLQCQALEGDTTT